MERIILNDNSKKSLPSQKLMSLLPSSDGKSLIVVRTSDGGGKQVEALPQKVIDEDSFVDSISSILDRDFFPELPKLRAYNEWLDAIQARDFVKMSEIRSKMRRSEAKRSSQDALMTPALQLRDETPDTRITESKRPKPIETVSDVDHAIDSSQLALDAKLMTLDEFLGKYTSEDDDSFSKLMEKEVTEARRVYQHIHDKARKAHATMVAEGKQHIGWKNYDPSHPSVFAAPRGLPRSFTPEEMRQGEKAVIPENTRFPEGGPSWSSQRPSSSLSPQSSSQSNATSNPNLPVSQPLDAQLYDQILKHRHGSLFEDVELTGPQIRDYPLVSTPKISAGNIDQSPLITWGEIADEAVKLDDSGLPLAMPSAESTSSVTAPHSGFSVPSLSAKSVSTKQLLQKASKKRAIAAHAAVAHAAAMASPLIHQTQNQSGLKTPLFQTTDTQLRSSYATPKVRSGKSSSTASTPVVRPNSSVPNTPSIKR